MQVPFGYAVDMFKNDGFSAEMKTVRGPFYTDKTMYAACIELNLNDSNAFDD